MCGIAPEDAPFDDEHVLPRWLLRRFGLFDHRVRLPNGASVSYSRYKVPCCVTCNSWLGRNIEAPVSELLAEDCQTLAARAFGGEMHLLFSWLALVFIKTHLKDTRLRQLADRRQASGTIGDLYDWAGLHHIHCLARAHYIGASLPPAVFGSTVILPSEEHVSLGGFDYGDNYASRAMMMRLDGTCVIAVLNDSCGALNLCCDDLSRIAGRLSPLQQRELLARLGYANQLIRNRPSYWSNVDSQGAVAFGAEVPSAIETHEWPAELYGRPMLECSKDVLELVPNQAELTPEILTGRFTFLFDQDGSFRTNSMIVEEDA